jgi:glutamyl/glutaminyl-tRNA synthetase
MEKVVDKMGRLPKPWAPDKFERTFRDFAQELGVTTSDMFQLIRIMVSGQLVTPPLFECIQILGEEETLKRAGEVLNKYPNLPDAGADLKVETTLS